MILPLDLGNEFVDVVQTPSGSEAQVSGLGAIGFGSGRLFNSLKAGAESLIYHPPKRGMELLCQRSGFVQNIVVDGECCSHVGIIASWSMMSRHRHISRTLFWADCLGNGIVRLCG